MRPLGVLAAALLAAAFVVPFSPARAAAEPTCQGERATIVGTAARDRLVGTPGPDVIVARGGDDLVLGRGGDDLICGGDGADALRGGAGDDRLHGQREARISDRGGTYFMPDLLDGGPGDDLLDVGGDERWAEYGSHGVLDYTHAPSGVTVDLAAGTATGAGSDTVVVVAGTEVQGSAHDDVLAGGPDDDLLVGNAGDDALDGRGGADQLFPDANVAGGPAGDDVVRGGPGNDFLSGQDGRDRLFGDDGRDTVWSTEGGPSEVHGGDGDDELVVWFPAEPGFVVDGGPGSDTAAVHGPAEAGADGRPTAATVTMADGSVVADETAWGQLLGVEEVGLYAELRWTYLGTDAPELVRSAGLSLDASTYGGDDEVWATSGRDRIDAGDGVDKVRAGRGRDTCIAAENVRGCEVRS